MFFVLGESLSFTWVTNGFECGLEAHFSTFIIDHRYRLLGHQDQALVECYLLQGNMLKQKIDEEKSISHFFGSCVTPLKSLTVNAKQPSLVIIVKALLGS